MIRLLVVHESVPHRTAGKSLYYSARRACDKVQRPSEGRCALITGHRSKLLGCVRFWTVAGHWVAFYACIAMPSMLVLYADHAGNYRTSVLISLTIMQTA